MEVELNFTALAEHLLGKARELLPMWLPGGKVVGSEYVCSGLNGGKGDSLSINWKTGMWSDFAQQDVRGGDLISLYSKIHRISNGDACKQLGDAYGVQVRPENALAVAAPKPRAKVKETVVGKPPADAGLPVWNHRSWGEPVGSWCYRDESGDPLFYVARYQPEPIDGEEQRKQIIPWSWSPDKGQFIQKGYPDPRPLYGLEQLADKPGWPVILVEGEKAADAARKLCGEGFVVMTWSNGVQSVKKVRWSDLGGRDVILWPDADLKTVDGVALPYHEQPGQAAMAQVAGLILDTVKSVKIIDVQMSGDFWPVDGWDAADALEDGWDWDRFAAWVKPRLREVKRPTVVEVLPAQEVAEQEADPEDAEEAPGQYTAAQYATWEQLGISLTQQGSPICNSDNVLRIMEGMPDIFKNFIWWDEFHMKYLTTDRQTNTPRVREWQDIDELRFTTHLQREYGLRRISSMMVRDACMVFANKPENIRNEPKDWINGLKWDEEPRIESFFRTYYGSIGTPYVAYASRNFWIGLAARILEPGSQVDTMVVLEGLQGRFKTRSLRAIGGPWYTDAKESVTTKDFYVTLQGKIIVEISELDSFGKAEVETIKKVITSSTDRFRPPYGRTAQDFPRKCVFVGTTNEDDYLRDVTGGRRFIPVQTGIIDVAAIERDREQLFAEAAVRFKLWQKTRRDEDGWWLMPEGTMEMQESRRRSDEWEAIIAKYLSETIMVDPTGADIAQYALNVDKSKLDMMIQKRVAKAMKALGWKSSMKRIEGIMTRYYIPPAGQS